MKRFRTILFLTLIVIGQVSPSGESIPVPPKKENLAGTWVGYDDYATSFFRLKLTTDECRFATTYPGFPIRVYNPTNWTLTQKNLKFQSIAPDKVEVKADGSAAQNRLVLNLTIGQWSGPITFFREDVLVGRLAQIREQMERISK